MILSGRSSSLLLQAIVALRIHGQDAAANDVVQALNARRSKPLEGKKGMIEITFAPHRAALRQGPTISPDMLFRFRARTTSGRTTGWLPLNLARVFGHAFPIFAGPLKEAARIASLDGNGTNWAAHRAFSMVSFPGRKLEQDGTSCRPGVSPR